MARGPDTPEQTEAKAQFRAYAIAHLPEFKRAAEEGYEVGGAVLTHVCGRIASAFPKASVHVSKDGHWTKGLSWAERDAPRPAAFEVRDKVKAHLAGMVEEAEDRGANAESYAARDASLPPCLELEVSRIMKVTHGDKRYTGVVVFVRSPISSDRAIVIPAE